MAILSPSAPKALLSLHSKSLPSLSEPNMVSVQTVQSLNSKCGCEFCFAISYSLPQNYCIQRALPHAWHAQCSQRCSNTSCFSDCCITEPLRPREHWIKQQISMAFQASHPRRNFMAPLCNLSCRLTHHDTRQSH